MQEIYSETYLKAKTTGKRLAIRILLIALMAIALLIGLIAMLSMGTTLVFIVMVLVAVVVYFIMPTNKVAYEYIFVDGQIDFDRILGGERRKTMTRTDLEKIEVIAPEGSYRLDSFRHLPIVDYSSGYDTDKHYIAVSTGEKGTEQIRFTPDEKMLSMMKLKSPSKIADE